MDFCQLLHKAQKNEQTSPSKARYYSTKYEPPKKVKKESKELSENIKRFLAKKEAEEQRKRDEEQRKKNELLALRSQDKKATRRVNVMLKRTKSANQSVIDDALDKTHTAVTRAGPEQPDEDDYGYVSQEATALYEKMMAKYSQMPEEPKFGVLKRKVNSNLTNTKDRVKAALEKERLEASQPHRRKRKRKLEDGTEVEEIEEVPVETVSKEHKPKKPKVAAPPPMSFTEILQIAAKKQHEPILVEEKPTEEPKLYTKKQKKELEREREYRERRERRETEGRPKDDKEKTVSNDKLPNGKKEDKGPSKDTKHSTNGPMKTHNDNINKKLNGVNKTKNNDTKPMSKPAPTNSGVFKKPSLPNGNRTDEDKLSHNKSVPVKSSNSKDNKINSSLKTNGKLPEKPKQFPPKDLIPRGKPKEFPPRDLKLKQAPSRDLGNLKSRPVLAKKGRILDDDEDEYDSEMDDFIDDGPEDMSYSNYIKEIFGYDKSRFRDMDDDVDNMESSFAQQMKEEVISTKIGIMEDLEDMKKEEEEKRRKALMKKKMSSR